MVICESTVAKTVSDPKQILPPSESTVAKREADDEEEKAQKKQEAEADEADEGAEKEALLAKDKEPGDKERATSEWGSKFLLHAQDGADDRSTGPGKLALLHDTLERLVHAALRCCKLRSKKLSLEHSVKLAHQSTMAQKWVLCKDYLSCKGGTRDDADRVRVRFVVTFSLSLPFHLIHPSLPSPLGFAIRLRSTRSRWSAIS